MAARKRLEEKNRDDKKDRKIGGDREGISLQCFTLCCLLPWPFPSFFQKSRLPTRIIHFDLISPFCGLANICTSVLFFPLHPILAGQQQLQWICALVSVGEGSGPMDETANGWFFPRQSVSMRVIWPAWNGKPASSGLGFFAYTRSLGASSPALTERLQDFRTKASSLHWTFPFWSQGCGFAFSHQVHILSRKKERKLQNLYLRGKRFPRNTQEDVGLCLIDQIESYGSTVYKGSKENCLFHSRMHPPPPKMGFC